MLTPARLRDLVRLSLTDPRAGGAAVVALNPPADARWLGMAAAVVSGVVLAYVLPVLAGRGAEVPPPLAACLVQMAANLVAAWLMAQVGRWFGGQGGFLDALLLVAWLQALMVLLQLAQLVAFLIAPPLAGFVMIAALGLFFWLLVGFIQALHGFISPLLVLGGTLATLVGAAFIASLILIQLGLDPRMLTDV